jgi:hypothetical protein
VSNLGWKADGIERARACGGVDLEIYQRPGFNGGKAIRLAQSGGAGSGFEAGTNWADDWEPEIDPTPRAFREKQCGR